MSWIQVDDTGKEHGIIDGLMASAFPDRHFVVELDPKTHKRMAYFHLTNPNYVERAVEYVRDHYYPDIEFFYSEKPNLTGMWLAIDSNNDYIDLLKLIPGAVKNDYFVNYDIIRSYGEIFRDVREEENKYDMPYTLYIQFRNNETAYKVKNMLEDRYGVESRLIYFS